MSKNGEPRPDNHVIVLFGATGDLAKAAAVRSTSQELTTEPRRQTSATSPGSIVYW